MYGFGYSSEYHVLVVVARAEAGSDADHEGLLRRLDRTDRDAAWRGRAVGVLFVTQARTPPPSVYWRQRFAEQRWTWRSPRVLMSFVSPSAIQRGVLTAIDWLRPAPAHLTTSQHPKLAEAVAWLEEQHGTPGSVISQLTQAAQAPALRTSVG